MTVSEKTKFGWSREEMARRVALDIPDGSYVNLGIGIQEKIAQFTPEHREIIYHTENGLLGVGTAPDSDIGDPDLINAGKNQVTAIAGAAYFDQADSFAMIRGGHIDICVLGAMQVSETGDLANWSTGSVDTVPAVGGAMDIVAGVNTVYVITQHCTSQGKPKLMKSCTYPLTGEKVVDRIYTDLTVIDVTTGGLTIVEFAPGVDLNYVQERTACRVIIQASMQN